MSDQPPVPPTQPTPPAGPPPAGGGATWQGVQPVVERPTEAMPPVPPPAPPPAPPTEPGGPAGGGGGASKGLIAAIVVVVLAILGVGAFLLLGGDDGDDDEARTPVEREDDDDADEETTTTTEAEDEEEATTTSVAEEASTTTVPPDGGATAGFTEVTDDTGTLVVSVPDTWTDVDGRPQSSGDLNLQASTDVEAFRNLEVSGVSYSLLAEANADPDTTLDFLTAGQVGGCDEQPREDYDDGVFTGREQTLTNCGDVGATFIIIVASNDAGQTVEVSTLIVPPDPVDEIHQEIVRSFNIVP